MTVPAHPPLCPKCGQVAICYYSDDGGVDYYDVYTLICADCGHREQQGSSGGSPHMGSTPSSCPYCGRDYSAHQVAAPERYDPPAQNHKIVARTCDTVIIDWELTTGQKLRQIVQMPPNLWRPPAKT